MEQQIGSIRGQLLALTMTLDALIVHLPAATAARVADTLAASEGVQQEQDAQADHQVIGSPVRTAMVSAWVEKLRGLSA